ncbi:uncharacterized protein N7511_009342 [Penicillium nucicola]|uniref:uncharacterized protein n=1 Tax=Penicillium nucicola TaxID=1850975 RepID=UPI002545217D|nr:uncharacterized protein N7511_009342 [Penicillium nucicola]KAJ5747646.1 hypothetical protein N7511_009342 [Penicillium nucicola]
MQANLSPKNDHQERGLQPSGFPSVPNEPCDARRTEKHSSVIPVKTGEDATCISPLLQLAWAIVIAAYTDSNDVVFGLCEKSNPSANPISPIQMIIQPEQKVNDMLKLLSTENHVVSLLSELDLSTSPAFPNILVIKNDMEDWTSTGPPMKLSGGHFDTCPLLLTGVDQHTEVHMHFEFDPEILSTSLSRIVMDRLVHIVNCIQTDPETQLKALLDISPNESKRDQSFNSRLQRRRQELGLHDVITKSEETTNSPSVCDWDGKSDQSQLSEVAWTETIGENASKGDDTPPTSRGSSVSPREIYFETHSEEKTNQDTTAVPLENVLETFPCTKTQQWVLNNNEGGCFVLEFSGPLDSSRLEDACQRLMESHTALRSIFTRHDGEFVQTVLKEFDLPFTVHTDVSQHPVSVARNLCTVNPGHTFPLGTLPLCFTLIAGSRDQNALMIQLSHSQYDSVCPEILVSDLCQFYQDPAKAVSSTEYALFAQEVEKQQTPEAFDFWRNILSDSSITEIPNTAPEMQSKNTILRCSTKVTIPSLPSGISMASMVKAAWSTILRQEAKCDDIVFAQLVNLRNMNTPNAHRTVGLCSNRVPVRVQYGQCKTTLALLQAVEDQEKQIAPFKAAEWESIVSHSTSWVAGCKPQSLVIHKDLSAKTEVQIGDDLRCHWADYIPIEPTDDSLKLYSEELQGGMLKLTLAYSSHFVPECGINGLLGKLRNTLMHFTDAPESQLEI